jgi:hypothetical protein
MCICRLPWHRRNGRRRIRRVRGPGSFERASRSVHGKSAILFDGGSRESLTHPEVNFEISAATKLPVADLEGDCHLVVLVEGLVEAFALVGLHLDVVRRRE